VPAEPVLVEPLVVPDVPLLDVLPPLDPDVPEVPVPPAVPPAVLPLVAEPLVPPAPAPVSSRRWHAVREERAMRVMAPAWAILSRFISGSL